MSLWGGRQGQRVVDRTESNRPSAICRMQVSPRGGQSDFQLLDTHSPGYVRSPDKDTGGIGPSTETTK